MKCHRLHRAEKSKNKKVDKFSIKERTIRLIYRISIKSRSLRMVSLSDVSIFESKPYFCPMSSSVAWGRRACNNIITQVTITVSVYCVVYIGAIQAESKLHIPQYRRLMFVSSLYSPSYSWRLQSRRSWSIARSIDRWKMDHQSI